MMIWADNEWKWTKQLLNQWWIDTMWYSNKQSSYKEKENDIRNTVLLRWNSVFPWL